MTNLQGGTSKPAATSRKRLRELALLEAFAAVGNFSFEGLESQRENPDFTASFEGHRIGIELTEFFNEIGIGSIQPQARTSLGGEIASRALENYKRLGGKPVHLSIGLTFGSELRNANRVQLADELAHYVVKWDPPHEHHSRKESPFLDSALLSTNILYLLALEVPTWSMALWHVPESGWVAPLEVAALQAIIDRKSPRLPDYHKAATEIWLIIATRGDSAGQLLDIAADFYAADIRSPFSRTYFFSAFDGRLVRLGRALVSAVKLRCRGSTALLSDGPGCEILGFFKPAPG